jgi:hypothetical protein
VGVGVQPAIALVQIEKEVIDVDYNEDVNQEEIPKFRFCILEVWTYHSVGGYLGAIFELLKCEDLNTGKIRYGRTGLLGFKFFIGLRRGHIYEISSPEYEKSVVIELSKFWTEVEIKLSEF